MHSAASFSGSGALRPPPPVVASLASSLRTPFPRRPPATSYPRSERGSSDRLNRRLVARDQSHRLLEDSRRHRAAEGPSSGGWGREGVRSEARAEQRLAPGGPQA